MKTWNKGGRFRKTIFRTLMLLMISVPAFSQDTGVFRIEIPSSFNPVGSGARAMGMGGTFISIADDATSASWNPGGLIQLDHPEMSVVLSAFSRNEGLSFKKSSGSDGDADAWSGDINYLSVSYPFHFKGYNMIVSLNYQHLYDFTREWDFPLSFETDAQKEIQQVSHASDGKLGAWGLAYALRLSPRLSVGTTLNFWRDGLDDNSWETRTRQHIAGIDDGTRYTAVLLETESYCFEGFNANFGVLWNINEHLSLGAVLKTPFRADVKRRSAAMTNVYYPDYPEANFENTLRTETDDEVDMPMSYGVGVSYRFSDQWTASLDLYRTHWEDFEWITESGRRLSPVTGTPSSETDTDPTLQVRLGLEYLYIGNTYVVPFRAGVFSDPRPTAGGPENVYGFSLGTGLGLDHYMVDIAYEYRFGDDLGSYMMEPLDFSYDLREHQLVLSIVYAF